MTRVSFFDIAVPNYHDLTSYTQRMAWPTPRRLNDNGTPVTEELFGNKCQSSAGSTLCTANVLLADTVSTKPVRRHSDVTTALRQRNHRTQPNIGGNHARLACNIPKNGLVRFFRTRQISARLE